MFGMSMTEILVILVIALLFLGPEKLPEAAKTISKGIRDLRKQTRDFQDTIENDTQLGGAIRDIKSALRGDDLRRPPVRKKPPEVAAAAATVAAELPVAPAVDPAATAGAPDAPSPAATVAAELPVAPAIDPLAATADASSTSAGATAADDDAPAAEDARAAAASDEDAELAAMIRPATGAVGRT